MSHEILVTNGWNVITNSDGSPAVDLNVPAQAINQNFLALTATPTQVNYCSGVTSAIQTQIAALAPSATPSFTGNPSAFGLIGNSAAPSPSAGAGAGGGSASCSGNNLGGQVSVTTGSSTTASSVLVTVTFANALSFSAAPYVVLFPCNAAAAALAGATAVYVSATTTTFVINTGTTALAHSVTYAWNYQITG